MIATRPLLRTTAVAGAGLIALYTGAIAGADAITKAFAGSFEAPQLFFFAALIVLVTSLAAARLRGETALRTGFVKLTALRSVLTVIAACMYFHAFRHLPFAEVFVFIGLAPVIAALLSRPVLGEGVRPQGWMALSLGVLGIFCLFPGGIAAVTSGHLFALGATASGTASIVLTRYIARAERNPLAQVFYPQLAIAITMGLALPFVWQPMTLADCGWIILYALLIFAARWLSVEALRLLPAHVATPLMNLQFVWMVLLGNALFGEVPGIAIYTGVACVVVSGLWLVLDEVSNLHRKALHRKAGSATAGA